MEKSSPANPSQFAYQGSELDAFADAINWKRYWASRVKSLIGGKVIEVGAGLGGSTGYLCDNRSSEWLCLDPDPQHIAHLDALIAAGSLPGTCTAKCGVLSDIADEVRVDTILYIDVLEHIEKDEEEMRLAAGHLSPNGRIIVLAPAFNFAYSAFDQSVGHFRRYVKADSARLTVPGLEVETVFYLDCIGLAAALANRLLMKTSIPSKRQVKFWDSALVPISTYADIACGQFFGKTIIMVWKKT